MSVQQIAVVLLSIVLTAARGLAQDPAIPPSPSLEQSPTASAPPVESHGLPPDTARALYQRAVDLLNTASNDSSREVPARPGGTFPEAVQALRTAIELSPEWAEPRLLLGEALFRAGDLDGALNEYRRILPLAHREPRAPLGLAKGLIAKQDWTGAQAALKESIRRDPTLAEAHYLLGAVLYSQGRLRAAMDSYRKTLWLKPTFPDAHYQLGLLLKLANRDKDAVEEFRLAAIGGIPEAQYVLGQAYRNGKGVTANLAQTIHWWIRATEQGHAQAWTSLKQLRRVARSSGPKAVELMQAFSDYRASLWQEVPSLTPAAADDSPGLALLSQERGVEALPLLIREAWGLSEATHTRLESLYEQGGPGGLPPFHPRILSFLEQCATEDQVTSKVTLARIYFLGLGVPKDHDRVKSLLKGLSKAERTRLLDQFASERPPQ